ncbi:MAG: Na(+)-translocating NADH-quinone reductase subunit C [Planctomycetota bacterium]
MQREGTAYTILFAAGVCVFCSILVCGSHVIFKDQQELNKRVDRQKSVLAVAGLSGEGKRLSALEANDLFEKNIVPRLVNLESGEYAAKDAVLDVASYDQRKARDDASLGMPAPPNRAQIKRVPRYAMVYFVKKEGKVENVILPIEGKGLWSTLYGFLALKSDGRTIHGITFYEHAETPGLGGEVDNPRWKARWVGRLAFDEKDRTRIVQVKRGPAGSPKDDPYQVDGLSGATITSNGVTYTMEFWLGERGFGRFLKALRDGAIKADAP